MSSHGLPKSDYEELCNKIKDFTVDEARALIQEYTMDLGVLGTEQARLRTQQVLLKKRIAWLTARFREKKAWHVPARAEGFVRYNFCGIVERKAYPPEPPEAHWALVNRHGDVSKDFVFWTKGTPAQVESVKYQYLETSHIRHQWFICTSDLYTLVMLLKQGLVYQYLCATFAGRKRVQDVKHVDIKNLHMVRSTNDIPLDQFPSHIEFKNKKRDETGEEAEVHTSGGPLQSGETVGAMPGTQ